MTNLIPELNIAEWFENSAAGDFYYISLMLGESSQLSRTLYSGKPLCQRDVCH
jgi:hypothetical protein